MTAATESRPSFVERRADIVCGTFSGQAITEVTGIEDSLTSQGRRQNMTLTVVTSGSRRLLDLDQHRSYDRALNGMLALDALAFTWNCFRSDAGRHYLFVTFICTNESATTCPAALDLPGREWTQIYDQAGRRLIKEHRGAMSEADERRLRTLGLWSEFVQSTDRSPTKFVYQ